MQNVQNLFRRKNFAKFLESRHGWLKTEMAALQVRWRRRSRETRRPRPRSHFFFLFFFFFS